MIKFTVVVLCVLVGFYSTASGDIVTLKNSGKDIDLKVIDVTDEYINAVIVKKAIKSLNMQFLDNKKYPDALFLNTADVPVECKIKVIGEDLVQVLIPISMISSLHMSVQPEEKEVKAVLSGGERGSKAIDTVMEKAEQVKEYEQETKIREDAGEKVIVDKPRTNSGEKTFGEKNYRLRTKKVKKENLEEGNLSSDETEGLPTDRGESIVDEKPPEASDELSEPNQRRMVKSSQNKEVEKTDEEESKKEKAVTQDIRLGRVEGKIVRSGSPLSDCQVKLQVLEKSGLLAKGYRPVEGAMELETITDNDGIYRFMNVPPGLYKLYWKPPTDTSWVRRFKMEPDVIVEANKLTNPKIVETMKRTLN